MRLKTRFLIVTLLVFLFVAVSLFGITDARLMRNPDIYKDKLVFVYGGDLWTSSSKGGAAVKLTTHKGVETVPFFSPDGKWIAFSAQYDGNLDVYVIPSKGGEPRRLTYHPGPDFVTGWSHDGKNLFFRSNRYSDNRYYQMFKVSVEGNLPERLPLPTANLGDQSPDGKFYAYTPLRNAFRWWRRYRGGRASYIWIYNFADYSVNEVPRLNCNDTMPQWMGKKLYFLSDRDKVMNLYSYDATSNKVSQITKHKGADIKSFGTDGETLVFEREGYLHILDAGAATPRRVTIDIPDEGLNTRPRYVKAGRRIGWGHISPNGKRAVFEARGEIVTVPVKKGDIRNLTNTPGTMERTPAWSPDGKWIAYFGEHKGEYALHIVDQKGTETPKIIEFDDPAYYVDLQWSPDSKKLSYRDSRLSLYYLDIEKEEPIKIASDTYFKGFYEDTMNYTWSPDSKWVAYSKLTEKFIRTIYLYSLSDEKSYQVTDGMSESYSPAFDKNGKYLYFAASTNKALDTAWADMSEYPHQPVSSLYLVVLSSEEKSPFAFESDEEEVKSKEKAKKVPKKKESEKKSDVKIDLKGIDQRIVAIKASPGIYRKLQADKGKLYYMASKRGARSSDLNMYDIKKRKSQMLIKGVQDFYLSATAKKILYQKRGSQWFIVDAGKKAKPGDGMLKLAALKTYSVPKAEWRQMLYEAWRINREFFYDPGMHGQDWPAVWKQYSVYAPYIAHRDDLNYVIGMMIGELAIGHAYVYGGELPSVDRVPGGLLGADYEIVGGYYRIKKIYKGENWNPMLRAPLTEPGIKINEGDYIISVNGRPVKATANIYSFFQMTAGKQVTLKVADKPDSDKARTFTVVPISNDVRLRHREWIEQNRKKVEEMSKGQLGYVYLPNTSVAGFTNFNRYYFAHLDKKGMVVDERYNGGGYAADYIIDHLSRPLLNYWKSRHGKPQFTPTASVFGPKVMIINDSAGSGGDLLPYYFKKRGLGKLVGTRTWGGVVGISGYPRLMDSGAVTSPTIGLITEEGKFEVENYGVAPDIQVDIKPVDFIAGRDPQLETAVKVALEALKTNPPKEFKPGPYPRGR